MRASLQQISSCLMSRAVNLHAKLQMRPCPRHPPFYLTGFHVVPIEGHDVGGIDAHG